MADVFVSYSRRDAEFVGSLVGRLEAAGCSVWLDQQGIPPSAEWMKEILGAIEGADCFLYVATPDAAASEVCALELRHALDNHKRIVPLLRIGSVSGVTACCIAALRADYMRGLVHARVESMGLMPHEAAPLLQIP